MKWARRACNRILRRADNPPPSLPYTRLSANFTLGEFIRSGTARRQDIDNTPPSEVVEHLQLLCRHVLQPARDALGPITVTSGYRCPRLNRVVGGARTSDHVGGYAADIVPVGGITLEALGRWIQDNVVYKQLIMEHNEWLHVSYDPRNLRQQTLEAYRRPSDRRTHYRVYEF